MGNYIHNPDDLTILMTANNVPSPNVVSASAEYSVDYAAWKAFNHSVGTTSDCWLLPAATLTGWLKFDFGTGNTETMVDYTISIDATAGKEARAPKTWTLQGSNNDSDWNVLDTRSDVPAWSAGEMRIYTVSNPSAYRYYKLNITANQGDSTYLSVGEVEFIYIAPEIIYYISGYVKEGTTPINRQIYLHNRDTGELVGSTTSSGAGGYFYGETTYSGAHYAVCLDNEIGVDYNDLIYGNILPATASG